MLPLLLIFLPLFSHRCHRQHDHSNALNRIQVYLSKRDTKQQQLKQLYISSSGFEWFLQKDRDPQSLYLIPLPYVGLTIHMTQDISNLSIFQAVGKRKEQGREFSFLSRTSFESYHFCSHSTDQNFIAWSHLVVKEVKILIFLNLVAIGTLQSFCVIGERKNRYWEIAHSLYHSYDISFYPYSDYFRGEDFYSKCTKEKMKSQKA